jgi:hypothetical protein
MPERLYVIGRALLLMSNLYWKRYPVSPARKSPFVGAYRELFKIIGTLFALSVGLLNSEKA